LAFNLFEDEIAFEGISPCGFKTETMISLQSLLKGKKVIKRAEFEDILTHNLIDFFSKLKS